MTRRWSFGWSGELSVGVGAAVFAAGTYLLIELHGTAPALVGASFVLYALAVRDGGGSGE